MRRQLLRSAAAVAATVFALGAAEPVRLTDGPGNDTEAVWAPDGRRVAFQSDRSGDHDILVLDTESGKVQPIVTGAGDSCFPAWSPDGRWLVYAHSHFTRTAAQGLSDGCNLFAVPAGGGTPRRLTSGLVRDTCPAFGPGGEQVYFSSTRGLARSGVCIQRIAFPAAGDPEVVIAQDQQDVGFVQSVVSPDGRLLAFGFLRGFRSNWRIALAQAANPSIRFVLTPGHVAAYGPRWSPDGSMLACTGYRTGDPGWGIALVQVVTGSLVRLDSGPGNSRNPAWSADGKSLVFENNRSGSYKLYRLAVPSAIEFVPPPEALSDELRPVILWSLEAPVEGPVKDASECGNHGERSGDLTWSDGGLLCGGGHVRVGSPKGLDFGRGAFSVTMTVLVKRHTDDLRLLVVGDYPESRLGWQIFINDKNCAYFNSRGLANEFVGARSDEPVPCGRRVQLTGIRHRDGLVELYVDGKRQGNARSGARLAYGPPTQVRLGTQYNGSVPFGGVVYSLGVYSGVLVQDPMRPRTLAEFLTR